MNNPFKKHDWKTIASCGVDVRLGSILFPNNSHVDGVVVIQEDSDGKRRAAVKTINREFNIDYDFAMSFMKGQGVKVP